MSASMASKANVTDSLALQHDEDKKKCAELHKQITSFVDKNMCLWTDKKRSKRLLYLSDKSDKLYEINAMFSQTIQIDVEFVNLIPDEGAKVVLEPLLKTLLRSLQIEEFVIKDMIPVIVHLMVEMRKLDGEKNPDSSIYKDVFYDILLICEINKNVFAFEVYKKAFPEYMTESVEYYKKFLMFLAIKLSTNIYTMDIMRAIPGCVRGMVGFYIFGSELCDYKWKESDSYYQESVNLLISENC